MNQNRSIKDGAGKTYEEQIDQVITHYFEDLFFSSGNVEDKRVLDCITSDLGSSMKQILDNIFSVE